MLSMMYSKVALCALLAASATAQPDTTPCDNNGAYDTDAGTASCGGFNVNIKALVCGDGFSQDSCVAKWTNGGGEQEWYYFMGAGAGMDASMLPAACSALPTTGLAMVQYKPDGTPECYPAADLSGSTMAYTVGLTAGGIPTSATLNFAMHDDGTDTRNGYIKITCAEAEGGFSTVGDSVQSSLYEVEVSAPCAGAPAPGGGTGDNNGGGGGGGVIFIIIVLAGSSVYFAGGYIFNWKVKHLEGRERIPHVDFWAGLPGLVKEGCRFLKSKVTRTDYAPL
jgi:hypothetical protein